MHIGSSNDSVAVKEQYTTSKGLNIRLAFHDMYSTNIQGYGNWLVSNYTILEGMKVLELGCGTGSLWMGRDEIIARCEKFIFTDLSQGMIETAKKNLWERNNIEYRISDIQDLDFEDNSFDVIMDLPLLQIREILAEHVVDGAIDLPKEYGMFECR